MKTLRTALCVAAAALFLGVAAMSTVRAADAKAPTSQPANTKCPITGDDVDKNVTTTYNGKTYAFCCADCINSFKKDPEKYASKAK